MVYKCCREWQFYEHNIFILYPCSTQWSRIGAIIRHPTFVIQHATCKRYLCIDHLPLGFVSCIIRTCIPKKYTTVWEWPNEQQMSIFMNMCHDYTPMEIVHCLFFSRHSTCSIHHDRSEWPFVKSNHVQRKTFIYTTISFYFQIDT